MASGTATEKGLQKVRRDVPTTRYVEDTGQL